MLNLLIKSFLWTVLRSCRVSASVFGRVVVVDYVHSQAASDKQTANLFRIGNPISAIGQTLCPTIFQTNNRNLSTSRRWTSLSKSSNQLKLSVAATIVTCNEFGRFALCPAPRWKELVGRSYILLPELAVGAQYCFDFWKNERPSTDGIPGQRLVIRARKFASGIINLSIIRFPTSPSIVNARLIYTGSESILDLHRQK
nr:hypothetical protein Iba_chr07bCG9020 [Ipomoea batatas]